MLWKLLPRHWGKKRARDGWCFFRFRMMKGNEDKWARMIGSEADLHVRSERWYVCQAIILFVQSQWPVPIGPGPDFICLSWSLSVGTYFSEGRCPLDFAHFMLFLIRWLTHWKADLVLCTVFPGPSTVAQPGHSAMQDRTSSVPMNTLRTNTLRVYFGIFLSELSHGG